ncbi:DUF7507 domain-containing protein, partial [Phyllobacterium leguminum]
KNAGKVTLSDVTVNDPMIAAKGMVLAPASYPSVLPGETVSFTATYQPVQADIDAGRIDNVATASAKTPDNSDAVSEPSAATINADVTAALTLQKSAAVDGADALYSLGETVTYSFTVRNAGKVTLSDVTVNDPMIAAKGMVLTPASYPAVLPGETVSFTATYRPDQADIDAGRIDNVATASAKTPDNGDAVSEPSAASVNADVTASLTLVKSAAVDGDDALYSLGETVTYSFTVKNAGKVTLSDVTVNDPMIAAKGMVLTPASYPAVLPGETVSFTATYRPDQADIDAGRIDNVATASAKTPDNGDAVSEPSAASVNADVTASLTLVKSAAVDGDDALYSLGETVTYSFTVKNEGKVTLSDVTVNDPMIAAKGMVLTPASYPAVLPGETVSFTATYQPVQADIDAGRIDNVATASAKTPDNGDAVSEPSAATINADVTASLTLVKSAAVDGDDALYSLGETVTYSFTVKNAGKVTLSDVTVNDRMIAAKGMVLTPASYPAVLPGETVSFTATYQPDQADIDAGRIDNVATASAKTPDNGDAVSEPSAASVEADVTAALTLKKSAAVDGADALYSLGETVTYSFTVKNEGKVTLSDVTVNDPMIAAKGMVLTPASYPAVLPGETVSFTATYRPDQADIDAGRIDNVATASAKTPDNGDAVSEPSAATVNADVTASLTLVKSAAVDGDDALYSLGETVTYSFTVKNEGKVTLSDVTVNDPMIAAKGMVLAPASYPSVLPGETVSFTATYRPDQADIDAGRIDNVATASAKTPDNGDAVSEPSAATINADVTASLTLVKSAAVDGDDALYSLGETVTYSFTVKNAGKVTLSDVTVNDPMIAAKGMVLTPASYPAVLPGETVSFTATYQPDQADIDAGRIDNVATASAKTPDNGDAVSAEATATLSADVVSGLTIDKKATLSGGDDILHLGETITYTFTVRNIGKVTMKDVTVNDPMLKAKGVTITPGPQTVAPGATAIFTAIYQPDQADIDAGQVRNTATGTGTPPSGPPLESEPDTEIVPPDLKPGLTIEKSGTLDDTDGDTFVDAGETITYTFVIKNTGQVTMRDVTVNDPMLSEKGITVTPGPQTLTPGAEVMFTAVYTAVQADIDGGRVKNTATGTGKTPSGGEVTSPPDEVTVPRDDRTGLTIDKQATLDDQNGNNVIDPGETIAYAFVAKNTGAVTMTNVTVNDPMLAKAGVVITPASVATLAPGAEATFTASYTPTQADIEAGSVSNTATASGTPPSGTPLESEPDTEIVPPVKLSRLMIVKKGEYKDNDNNGQASPGDELIYRFTITNTGGQTIEGVSPVDDGPTFNGIRGTGKLSAFTPESVTLEPYGEEVFTATYALTQADIDNSAGQTEAIANSATAKGNIHGGPPVPSTTSTSKVTIPPVTAASDISIIKQAGLRQIKRGQKAPFTIKVTNHSSTSAGLVTVTDFIPPGFRYVDGSATAIRYVDDPSTAEVVAVTPVVTGQRVRFDNIELGPKVTLEIRLQMLALSTATPGKHTNKAVVSGPDGEPLAPEARADIEIMIEPVFDCGDIVGKVFDDVNRNGYQDKGEPGLPGVRIATVRGSLVTTDKHGRFHVACADLPDNRIGSNFIMKLDPRTLPAGYRLTTENPRVIRLTAGKMSKLNFGASIGRVVRLDLTDAAFEPDTTTLKTQWQKGLDRLIEALESEPSTLRLGYGAAADAALARQRIRAIEEDIAKRWKSVRGRYELTIETRVEAGQ